MKSRKEVIVSFFSFLLESGIEYSILHHANRVFFLNNDIDFIVDCQVRKMLRAIKLFCEKADNLYLVNFYSIDKNIYRFDVIIDLDNKIELLELDCTCKNSGRDFLKIRTKPLLERKIWVNCDGYNLLKVSHLDEMEHYIQKKAFKHVEYGNTELSEHLDYLKSLDNSNEKYIKERFDFWVSYYSSFGFKILFYYRKLFLTFKRFKEKSAMTICFLGPDGSGKSTIIDLLLQSPLFVYKYYFHLKPIPKGKNNSFTVAEPHKNLNYSALTSYLKLVYFIIQYNLGWLRYIFPLKLKSSMVIFDRYYDDLLVDNRRYRYGGSTIVARLVKKIIPRPDIYFLLTADPKIIYQRKKEVPFAELERQIEGYRLLNDGKRYFNVNVAKSPKEITGEIIRIIIKKAYERY